MPCSIQKVSSLEQPELKPYRTMRLQAEHRGNGIFVAEGDKLVQRLLETPLEVVSLLLEEKWLKEFLPLIEKRPENIQIYLAERSELQRVTGYSLFQGALGVACIPTPKSLKEIMGEIPRPAFLVAVDGVANAINVGSIIRNSAAFGVQGFISGKTSASPWLRRAVRNSMGAIFHLPIIETEDLVDALRQLRLEGVQCVAAHPHADGLMLTECDFSGDSCVVFGSEGYGLSPEVLEVCDVMAAIPTTALVDSLNVASASGIFLHEVQRQRKQLNGY